MSAYFSPGLGLLATSKLTEQNKSEFGAESSPSLGVSWPTYTLALRGPVGALDRSTSLQGAFVFGTCSSASMTAHTDGSGVVGLAPTVSAWGAAYFARRGNSSSGTDPRVITGTPMLVRL